MSSTKGKNIRRGRSGQSLNQGSSMGDPEKQGTVLVRNPMPKYSFELKSKSNNKSKSGNKVVEKQTDSETVVDKTVTQSVMSVDVQDKPVGNLASTCPQALACSIPESRQGVNSKDVGGKPDHEEGVLRDKPVNKVDPFSTRSSDKRMTQSASDSSLIHPQTVDQSNVMFTLNQPSSIPASAAEPSTSTRDKEGTSQGTDLQLVEVDGNQSGLVGIPCCACREKVHHLEEEKQMLKNQLEVQHQVNFELKKLLVASVGDDLHHRVERLTRDKALLCQEVGDYTKKMSEGYEQVDQISIQADMWRSKYLACRVMADELASSKAFFSLQFEEAQRALQQLLNERHELRAHLYDTYRGLQQIQEAFDPLKTLGHSSHLLNSKNVLDLARTNQHLTDTVKYRLLPSHVTSVMNSKMEPDWADYLTLAESRAQELLTREVRPEDFRCLGRQAIMATPDSVDRFHPCARYDNLTLNVCCKCKGDIRIV